MGKKSRKRNIKITEEQLDSIEHYQRMFRVNSEALSGLCQQERDDVVYGFELGQLHKHLEECFIEMLHLTEKIRKNNRVK